MRNLISAFILSLAMLSVPVYGQVTGEQTMPFPSYPKFVDFNSDGIIEMVAMHDDRLKIFRLDGFKPVIIDEIFASDWPFSVIDIQRDGYPEILVNNYDYLYYYINDEGNLKNTKVHIATVGFGGPDFLTHGVQDMDSDGDEDIVVLREGNLLYLHENVDGDFQVKEPLLIANFNVGGGGHIKFCDYNQDGRMDVMFLQGYEGVYKVINNGDLTFTSKTLSTRLNQRDFEITDFDLDGFPDVVISCARTSSVGNGSVIIVMNPASVGPKLYARENLHFPYAVAVANLDEDAVPEILIGDESSLTLMEFKNQGITNQVLWGDPDIEFPGQATDLLVHDFNLDGKLEVAYMVLFNEQTLLFTDYDTSSIPIYSCQNVLSTAVHQGDFFKEGKIYPNPASENIYVDYSGTPETMVIIDLQGKILGKTSNQNSISVENLSPGIYFLQVVMNDQTYFHPVSIAH